MRQEECPKCRNQQLDRTLYDEGYYVRCLICGHTFFDKESNGQGSTAI